MSQPKTEQKAKTSPAERQADREENAAAAQAEQSERVTLEVTDPYFVDHFTAPKTDDRQEVTIHRRPTELPDGVDADEIVKLAKDSGVKIRKSRG